MVFFLFFLSKLQLRKKCRICQTKSFLGRIIVVHPLPLSAGGVSDTDYTSLPNLYETVQIEKEREREDFYETVLIKQASVSLNKMAGVLD